MTEVNYRNQMYPCPKCQGYVFPYSERGRWGIWCATPKCLSGPTIGINEITERDAKAAWNRRRKAEEEGK